MGGTEYSYDSNSGWIVPGSGGGSGGGDSAVLKVTFTGDGHYHYAADKTYEEIADAFSNGMFIFGMDVNTNRQLQFCECSQYLGSPARFLSLVFSKDDSNHVWKNEFMYEIHTDDSVKYWESSANS